MPTLKQRYSGLFRARDSLILHGHESYETLLMASNTFPNTNSRCKEKQFEVNAGEVAQINWLYHIASTKKDRKFYDRGNSYFGIAVIGKHFTCFVNKIIGNKELETAILQEKHNVYTCVFHEIMYMHWWDRVKDNA